MGLKKPSPLSFPILLSMRPSTSQLPPWGLPTSLMIPTSLSISLWGPLFLQCARFPSFVVLFPLLSLPEVLQPLPFLHGLLVARLWVWEQE